MAPRIFHKFANAFVAATSTLDYSLSPSLTLSRLRAHKFTIYDSLYVVHIALAAFWLTIMTVPPFPFKLAIPLLYTAALLVPLTSQFFVPATPVFSWVLTFYSSRFIPPAYRPAISVSLLPTLESVLYGANISDILTRFTHPILDIIAWIPYGVVHFSAPVILSAFLWLFAPKPALHFWAQAFGYMNLIGVICQIIFPCAAPWYELMYGLTPADYSMKGSPGGLARIDALFHSNGYTTTFSNAPVVFGAFPSLHAGWATVEALFVSHFFAGPGRAWVRTAAWGYTGVLYWATMYLTHHYLVDVVGGACLATGMFYFFLPAELAAAHAPTQRSKYELYDLDVEAEPGYAARRALSVRSSDEYERAPTPPSPPHPDDVPMPESSDPDEEEDIGFRPPSARLPFLSRALQGLGARDRAYRKVPNSPSAYGRVHHHKRTASIASLVGTDERTDAAAGGWGIVVPPPSPRTTGRHGGLRTPRSGRPGDVTPRGEAQGAP